MRRRGGLRTWAGALALLAWLMLLALPPAAPARAGQDALQDATAPPGADPPAPLLEVTAQGPGWRAVARMAPSGWLSVELTRDGVPPARCEHGWYWGLDASAREHPRMELSFDRCACPEPPAEDAGQNALEDAGQDAERALPPGTPILRPNPMLWLDLREVDKPVVTLYLFRLRPPSVGAIRALDLEGLKLFMAAHPWKENHKPCSF